MDRFAAQTAVNILEKEKSPGDNGQSRAGMGGPKTEEGKKISSRNAERHGFCAATLAPEIAEAPESQKLLKQFMEEYEPHSATAKALVHELWRHECVMRRIAKVEDAALRQVEEMLCLPPAEEASDAEKAWKHLDLLGRYRRTHERGFHDALRRLMELRADQEKHPPGRKGAGNRKTALGPKPFEEMPDKELAEQYGVTRSAVDECMGFFRRYPSELECQEHVADVHEGGTMRCGECGKPIALGEVDGEWLCVECGANQDLRRGTIMEGTEVPMMDWMWAAALVQMSPTIPEGRLLGAMELHQYRGGDLVWKRLHGLVVPEGSLAERVDACLMTKVE